jgi:hypothetical protein
MKAIHFLCHQEDLKPRNSRELPPMGKGRYRLGWWALTGEEADSLIGGFAYLHETNSELFYSENRIVGHVPGEAEWSGLVGLIHFREPKVGHQKWRDKKARSESSQQFSHCASDFVARTGGAAVVAQRERERVGDVVRRCGLEIFGYGPVKR